jgi:hypothetical protein
MKEDTTIILFASSDYKKLGEATHIDASRQMSSQMQLVCKQLPVYPVFQKDNDHLLSLDITGLFQT